MKSLVVLLCLIWLSTGAAMARDDVLRRVYVTSQQDYPADSVAFDPSSVSGIYLWQTVLEDLFEPLVTMTSDGDFVPGAAESWSYSDDGMTLTVELDKTAVWSDGTPITAGDYVFVFERIKNEKFAVSPPQFVKAAIAGYLSDEPLGVTALSPTRLQFKTTSPYTITDSMMSEMVFAPLPRHLAPDKWTPWSKWPKGVTNGPFTLEAIDGHKIKLRRNPYAPIGKRPFFDRAELILSDWSEGAKAFLSGNADYLSGIPSRQMEWFEHHNIEMFARNAQTYFYVLNKNIPQLADSRVRRALRLAIDRPALVKQLLPSHAKPAYSLIPEGIRGYLPDPSLRIEDVGATFAEARSLMQAAGYGPDHRLAITISSNDKTLHRNIAEFIKSGWAQIYVDATLDFREKSFETWFRRFSEGDYIVARRSWNTEKPRMDSFMNACRELNDPYCGYFSDPAYAALLTEAYAATDIEQRRDKFRQADRVLTESNAIIPLYHGIVAVAIGDRIDVNAFRGKLRKFASFEMKLR